MKVFVNRYVKGSSQVYACLIDVSKVFDTVDHYVLYKKLLDNALVWEAFACLFSSHMLQHRQDAIIRFGPSFWVVELMLSSGCVESRFV